MGMPQLRNAKRRNYKRPLIEQLPSLDCRWLTRHGMVPKDWSRRVYSNFTFVNPGFPCLVITACMIEIYFSDGRRQQIVPMHWQTINGMCQGAIRPIFGCPRCRRHAFRLFDLYGELHCWKCAASRGAIYASQAQSAKGRAALQALRLRHFLNGWADLPPSKPALMHKQTYRRLTSQLHQLEAKSRSKLPAKASGKLDHRVIKPKHIVQNSGRQHRQRLIQCADHAWPRRRSRVARAFAACCECWLHCSGDALHQRRRRASGTSREIRTASGLSGDLPSQRGH
jgi:hypothetical protein